MTTLFDERGREIIPRWRHSGHALERGEMTPLQPGEGRDFKDYNSLRILGREWEETRSLSVAADLLNEAYLSGSSPAVVEAARFVLENAPRTTSSDVVALAQDLLAPDDIERPFRLTSEDDGDVPQFQYRIRRLRASLRTYPRNAFAWADLAHSYAAIGAVRRAVDAMDVALKLAPHDRYILRSAARLAVHADNPERAIRILRRGVGQRDPWIAAAEIAVSSLLEEPAKFASIGKRMAESAKLAPFHKAEVTSAIATLEGASGGGKRAKKLFRESLTDPTENAVAQAEWASKNLVRFEVPQEHLQRPDTFEARTIDAFSRGAFDEAFRNSWRWLIDQPFSVDPARDGSFFASVGMEDYEGALGIIGYAEAANPKDWLLLNNKAFALLSLNRIAEAEKALSWFKPDRNDVQQYGTWLATTGMLHFRRGDSERGRQFYKAALDQWANHPRNVALAAAFWAREEMLCAKDDAYEGAFKAAVAAASNGATPDVELLRKRLVKLHETFAENRRQTALNMEQDSSST